MHKFNYLEAFRNALNASNDGVQQGARARRNLAAPPDFEVEAGLNSLFFDYFSRLRRTLKRPAQRSGLLLDEDMQGLPEAAGHDPIECPPDLGDQDRVRRVARRTIEHICAVLKPTRRKQRFESAACIQAIEGGKRVHLSPPRRQHLQQPDMPCVRDKPRANADIAPFVAVHAVIHPPGFNTRSISRA